MSINGLLELLQHEKVKQNFNKKRNKKTSVEQMTMIVNFLEKHRNFLNSGKKSADEDAAFTALCSKLNLVHRGSRKSKEHWRRFLQVWKSKTKAKAKLWKRDLKKTDRENSAPELNPQEERLMKLVGWNIVEGWTPKPPESNPQLLLDSNSYESPVQGVEDPESPTEVFIKVEVDEEKLLPPPYDKGPENTERPTEVSIENENDMSIKVEESAEEEVEEEESKEERHAHAQTIKRRKTPLMLAAESYERAAEKILKASEIIAKSIAAHASALEKCAESISRYAEK